MLIHNQECGWGASVAETWKALEAALAAGQTKSIGVSHFGVSLLPRREGEGEERVCVHVCV